MIKMKEWVDDEQFLIRVSALPIVLKLISFDSIISDNIARALKLERGILWQKFSIKI